MRITATKKLAVPLLAAGLLATGNAASAQQYAYGYGYSGYQSDVAPGEYHQIERQGFQDGLEGAQRDYQNHRRPTPNNRDEFRHPHVPGFLRHEYREGFFRGYQVGVHQIYEGGGFYR